MEKIIWISKMFIPFICLLFWVSCGPTSSPSASIEEEPSSLKADTLQATPEESLVVNKDTIEDETEVAFNNNPSLEHYVLSYPWLKNYTSEVALDQRIPPPNGYKRTSFPSGSFANWLRKLPLKENGSPVFLYDKTLKSNQNAHYAVVDLDVDPVDLQQCADAVMRLKAAFHYGQKAYPKIHFNYTSGDRVSFDDWRKGKHPKISGNKVIFVNDGRKGNDYANFRKYLKQIFMYAGTASLSKEMNKVTLKDLTAGDVFIQGGHPGHAVIILDVVENDRGDKQFLIGQSYMPAQDFHVLKNPNNSDSPWYPANFLGELHTPEWTFAAEDLKRFE